MDHLSVAFVGHIDHGKSTLSGRLLYDTGSLPEEKMEDIRRICRELGHEMEFAYILDHLREEREQNMTIDTTQTFFHTPKRHYVIIDAPGHKEFLKNMITGASQADAAVLLLDVKEGVQEQTKRHAFILNLLGLKQNIVAINKMDLVDYDQQAFIRMRDSLLPFLDALHIRPAAVIPISAKKGENVVHHATSMPWYAGPSLSEALDAFLPIAQSDHALRLFIQDVYSIKGESIAAGRVESGTLHPGQAVLIAPDDIRTTVSSVHKFVDRVDRAEAGECIGVTVASGVSLRRGQVLCDPVNRPSVSRRFLANVFWLDQRPFRVDQPLTLRLSTQDVPCRCEGILQRIDSSSLVVLEENASQLMPTEVGNMIIRTESPIVLETFSSFPNMGRFALEQGMHVVAGGIVINPNP